MCERESENPERESERVCVCVRESENPERENQRESERERREIVRE